MAKKIRELLGARESIGNLRVSSVAIELDLFAEDKDELEGRLQSLRRSIGDTTTTKLLDKIVKPMTKVEVLEEATSLFNEERYWEAHEVLEQVWQPATGVERDTVQGIIMAAAGLVHHQKDRDKVSLGMLAKALKKMDEQTRYEDIDVASLRRDIQGLLDRERPEPLRIRRLTGPTG